MCSPQTIIKTDLKRTGPDSRQLGESQNRVDARSRSLAAEIERWLGRYARSALSAVVEELEQSAVVDAVTKAARHPVRKASRAQLEDQLRQILLRHGMRMTLDSSQRVSAMSGGASMPPRAMLEFIASKEIRLKQIEESTRRSVQTSLRQMFAEAMQEDPKPSTGEIARRIRTSFLGQEGRAGRALTSNDFPIFTPTRMDVERETGPGTGFPFREGRPPFSTSLLGQDISPVIPSKLPQLATRRVGTDEGGKLTIFGSNRAALIARTEMVQAENAGIIGGMSAVGVREIKWLAYRDGRSGSRHHERMNRHPAVTLGAMFTLPSGVEMPYPGWPQAPISEIANCRCTVRAVRN